jgi:hypothetical protein
MESGLVETLVLTGMLFCMHIFIKKKASLTVRLYPEDCRKEQSPIASFTIRILVRGSDGQPVASKDLTGT